MPAFARIPLTAETRPRRPGAATIPALRGSWADTAQSGSTCSGVFPWRDPTWSSPAPVSAARFAYGVAVQAADALRAYAEFNLLIFKDGDALITRARASLISQFLDDPSATHLLFIDADIGFEPEQVVRLIQCGAEMCAAVYPIKRIDWDKALQRQSTVRGPNPAGSVITINGRALKNPNAVVCQGGLRPKVRYAGTGFLMIRRRRWKKCARKLSAPCSTSAITRLDAATASDKRFALFECMIAEDGTYLSEDFAFWQALDRHGRRRASGPTSTSKLPPRRADDVSRRRSSYLPVRSS